MTPEETAVAEADAKYWQHFGQKMGWQLCGFTFRESAGFHTPLPGIERTAYLNITGQQKETIERAIRAAVEAEGDRWFHALQVRAKELMNDRKPPKIRTEDELLTLAVAIQRKEANNEANGIAKGQAPET